MCFFHEPMYLQCRPFTSICGFPRSSGFDNELFLMICTDDTITRFDKPVFSCQSFFQGESI